MVSSIHIAVFDRPSAERLLTNLLKSTGLGWLSRLLVLFPKFDKLTSQNF